MVTTKTVKKTHPARKPRAPKSDHRKERADQSSAHGSAHQEPLKHKEPLKDIAKEAISQESAENKARSKYFFAVGRRKTAVANVRLFYGQNKNLANNMDIEKYFMNPSFINLAIKPMQLTGTEGQYYVHANIRGGGIHAQSQALAHGIARAIVVANPEHRRVLKKNGMLTRDSRMKERKKPGLKRARRGPQWAKR